eukprot:6679496-Prymnesium_polylepis.1
MSERSRAVWVTPPTRTDRQREAHACQMHVFCQARRAHDRRMHHGCHELWVVADRALQARVQSRERLIPCELIV